MRNLNIRVLSFKILSIYCLLINKLLFSKLDLKWKPPLTAVAITILVFVSMANALLESEIWMLHIGCCSPAGDSSEGRIQ